MPPGTGLHIQYAGAVDGVSIAFLMLGEGVPIVLMLWALPETVPEAANEFLGETEAHGGSGEPSADDSLRTVLITDVEGSTALMRRLGDRKARKLLRAHELLVLDRLEAHGALNIKNLGDGLMAAFSSATRALECAIDVQRACAKRNRTASEAISVRVGLNVGEATVEKNDLFGAAVNLAARITAKAKGGEILASDVVRQLAAGRLFLFKDRGEVAMRGFNDPVRLFEVAWEA
jgi:class 3 adenylate cyclase